MLSEGLLLRPLSAQLAPHQTLNILEIMHSPNHHTRAVPQLGGFLSYQAADGRARALC